MFHLKVFGGSLHSVATKHLSKCVRSPVPRRTISFSMPDLPEKYKGTLIEKWYLYWKGLMRDYRDVSANVIEEIRTKPRKAFVYAALGSATYYSAKNNPDERSFQELFRNYTNEIGLVPEALHNPVSQQYLRFLERGFNEGVIRRFSIGVASFMWIDDYDAGIKLYRAICPHMQTPYLAMHKHIIDVGFMNRWFILTNKMKDYDVNAV